MKLTDEAMQQVSELFGTETTADETRLERLPSDVGKRRTSKRVDATVLPDNKRKMMPMTKDDYLIRENPVRISWEREVRKFLRKLSPQHEHRISAVMIYEWATGLRVRDLEAALVKGDKAPHRSDLRHINAILRGYFGKAYATWIAGRKVPTCYKVPVGWLVYGHRPQTLTLWSEWKSGVKL